MHQIHRSSPVNLTSSDPLAPLPESARLTAKQASANRRAPRPSRSLAYRWSIAPVNADAPEGGAEEQDSDFKDTKWSSVALRL